MPARKTAASTPGSGREFGSGWVDRAR